MSRKVQLGIVFGLFSGFLMTASGCGVEKKTPAKPSNGVVDQSSSQALSEATRTEGSFTLSCGPRASAREGDLHYQVHTPRNWSGNLFAVLLNGSPGTTYFSETQTVMIAGIENSEHGAAEILGNYLRNQSDSFRGTLGGLLGQGYRVLEVKYDPFPRNVANPQDCAPAMTNAQGFYSLCCKAGLDAVQKHNEDLYDAVVEKLGYDAANSSHKLLGFGASLGGLQIQAAAFNGGKKFHKVVITGVLMGNVVEGCRQGRMGGVRSEANGNNMGWQSFMGFANALTRSGDGCAGSTNEYTAQYNFSRSRFRPRFDLLMLEGERDTDLPPVTSLSFSSLDGFLATLRQRKDVVGLHGAPAQARYIKAQREASTSGSVQDGALRAAPEATTLKTYSNCGHEVFFCSEGRALADFLSYSTPAREALDFGRPLTPSEGGQAVR